MLRSYPRSKFVTAEKSLGACSAARESAELDAARFSFLRDHHGLVGHLPSRVRINVATLAQSDLPRRGKHINSTVDVPDPGLSRSESARQRRADRSAGATQRSLSSSTRSSLPAISHRATDYKPWSQSVGGRPYVVHQRPRDAHAAWITSSSTSWPRCFGEQRVRARVP